MLCIWRPVEKHSKIQSLTLLELYSENFAQYIYDVLLVAKTKLHHQNL